MAKNIEAYAKQSYNAYVKKVQKLQESGRGIRAPISYREYSESYLARKEYGLKTKGLSDIFTTAAIVFSRAEALNIANTILQAVTDEEDNVDITKLDELNLNITTTKKGGVNITSLSSQIMQLTPMQAHDFVAAAIDLGLYSDGRSFEGFTY